MTAPSDQPPRFTSGAVPLNPVGPRRSKHRDGSQTERGPAASHWFTGNGMQQPHLASPPPSCLPRPSDRIVRPNSAGSAPTAAPPPTAGHAPVPKPPSPGKYNPPLKSPQQKRAPKARMSGLPKQPPPAFPEPPSESGAANGAADHAAAFNTYPTSKGSGAVQQKLGASGRYTPQLWTSDVEATGPPGPGRPFVFGAAGPSVQPKAPAKASQRTDGSKADLPRGTNGAPTGSARSPRPYVPPLWSSRPPAGAEKLPEPFVFGRSGESGASPSAAPQSARSRRLRGSRVLESGSQTERSAVTPLAARVDRKASGATAAASPMDWDPYPPPRAPSTPTTAVAAPLAPEQAARPPPFILRQSVPLTADPFHSASSTLPGFAEAPESIVDGLWQDTAAGLNLSNAGHPADEGSPSFRVRQRMGGLNLGNSDAARQGVEPAGVASHEAEEEPAPASRRLAVDDDLDKTHSRQEAGSGEADRADAEASSTSQPPAKPSAASGPDAGEQAAAAAVLRPPPFVHINGSSVPTQPSVADAPTQPAAPESPAHPAAAAAAMPVDEAEAQPMEGVDSPGNAPAIGAKAPPDAAVFTFGALPAGATMPAAEPQPNGIRPTPPPPAFVFRGKSVPPEARAKGDQHARRALLSRMNGAPLAPEPPAMPPAAGQAAETSTRWRDKAALIRSSHAESAPAHASTAAALPTGQAPTFAAQPAVANAEALIFTVGASGAPPLRTRTASPGSPAAKSRRPPLTTRNVKPFGLAEASTRMQALQGSTAAKEGGEEKYCDEEAVKAADRARERGNMMFSQGHFARAESFYKTRELFGQAAQLLAEAGITAGMGKLHSNLAATKLAVREPLAALDYCHLALLAEPGFTKARVRAATCHLRLGRLEEAEVVLREADDDELRAEVRAKLDEAAQLRDALAKVREAEAVASSAAALAAVAAEGARLLSDFSMPFCDPLAALISRTLLRLSRLKEAEELARRHLKLCERRAKAPVWPVWTLVQTAFHSGNLAEAGRLLQEWLATNMQQEALVTEDGGSVPRAELADAAAGVNALLALKEAGNTAMQARDHEGALRRYGEALTACEGAAPAFAAVLHSNRAAAFQAKGRLSEAIADCLRACALDPTYAKAQSRLAGLLMEWRHVDGAASALQALVALLHSHADKQGKREAETRLREAQAGMCAKLTADHYKLLGLSRNCSQDEVRRAYKTLALRFHPDKALVHCRFARALSPSAAHLINHSEVEARVRAEADWLFKCIGAANAMLSDPKARQALDADLAFQERWRAGGMRGSQGPSGPTSWPTRPAPRRGQNFPGHATNDDYGYRGAYHEPRNAQGYGFTFAGSEEDEDEFHYPRHDFFGKYR